MPLVADGGGGGGGGGGDGGGGGGYAGGGGGGSDGGHSYSGSPAAPDAPAQSTPDTSAAPQSLDPSPDPSSGSGAGSETPPAAPDAPAQPSPDTPAAPQAPADPAADPSGPNAPGSGSAAQDSSSSQGSVAPQLYTPDGRDDVGNNVVGDAPGNAAEQPVQPAVNPDAPPPLDPDAANLPPNPIPSDDPEPPDPPTPPPDPYNIDVIIVITPAGGYSFLYNNQLWWFYTDTATRQPVRGYWTRCAQQLTCSSYISCTNPI